MKVMFDTNIYISFIRNRSHSAELEGSYAKDLTSLTTSKSQLRLYPLGRLSILKT